MEFFPTTPIWCTLYKRDKNRSEYLSASEVSIDGYINFRQDRTKNGGGTLVYVAEYLSSKKIANVSNKECEAIWV